jgi:MFS family permease
VQELHNQDLAKPPQPSAIRPWSSLLIRDYQLIFVAIFCANTSMHMRNVASLYLVYALSGSSMQLGIAGFFQALPFICFGLLGGVLADTFNRKKLILVTQALNCLPGFILGVLTASGRIEVWHIYFLNLLASSLQVLSNPARQALVPSLIPPSHLLNAVTLTTLLMQGAQLAAPVIAGFLIDLYGAQASYFTDAGLLLPAICAVLLIRHSGQPSGARQRVSWRSLIEGFEFLWHTPIILSLFLLDFFAVLVGYYRPILPIFARDVFNVDARGLGALYAAPAVGALIGSGLLLAAGDVRRKGALSIIATLLFAFSLMFLGLSKWFWMGLIAVGALGFTDSITVALRRTVVQILSPDNMRGRASSFLTVFAQTTNAVGAIIAGAGAALLGASHAALAGGILGTLLILAVCWRIPQLWSYQSD